MFKHVKQNGVLDGFNPMVDVSVPGRPVKFKGKAYAMSEVARMLEDWNRKSGTKTAPMMHDRTASEAITILVLSGLRVSECRGLR